MRCRGSFVCHTFPFVCNCDACTRLEERIHVAHVVNELISDVKLGLNTLIHTHTTNMHAKLIEKKNKLQNAKNKIDQNQRYLVKQIGKIGDFVGGKCEKLQKLWSVKIDYR